MKKVIPLISVMLLSITASEAQTINIIGTELSILTLLPILLTGLVVIFFIGIFIKDALTKKKNPKSEKREEEKEIKESVKEEKREPEKKDEKEIFRALLIKSRKIDSEASSIDVKEALLQLDSLAKDFFKEKYKLSKEFSLSELKSLANLSKEERKICEEVGLLKFSGEREIKSDRLKKINSNLSKLIRTSFYSQKEQKRLPEQLKFLEPGREFLDKQLEKLHILKSKEGPTETPKLPEMPIAQKEEVPITPVSEGIEKEKKHEISAPPIFYHLKRLKILRDLNDGIKISKENVEQAKKIYGKSLISYYSLPVNEEEKITNKLTELYSKIKDEETHEKEKIGEKTRQIIQIKREGRKKEEAKKLLDSVERWVTEVSIREEIRKEYKAVISGISDSIKKVGRNISKFEHKEADKLSELIEKAHKTLKGKRREIVLAIENTPHNLSGSIRTFEQKEQEKVTGFINKLERISKIQEKKEKLEFKLKDTGLIPQKKEILTHIRPSEIKKQEKVEVPVPENVEQKEWYKGIFNLKVSRLPRVKLQENRHPTEEEISLFKHKIELPKATTPIIEKLSPSREIHQVKTRNQRLRRLLAEEQRVRQKMEEIESINLNQSEIENLRMKYKIFKHGDINFTAPKSKKDKASMNKLLDEEERLRRELASLN